MINEYGKKQDLLFIVWMLPFCSNFNGHVSYGFQVLLGTTRAFRKNLFELLEFILDETLLPTNGHIAGVIFRVLFE